MSILAGLIAYLHWRSDQVDSDWNLWISDSNTSSESILDCVNTFVCEARALEVSPNLDSLLCKLPLNVLHQNLLGLLVQPQVVQQAGVGYRLFEIVISSALNTVINYTD